MKYRSRCLFVVILVLCLLVDNTSTLDIQLLIYPSNRVTEGDRVTVECRVTGLTQATSLYSLFLMCPLVGGGTYCFEECTSICAGGQSCPNQEQLNTVYCRPQSSSYERSNTYTIPRVSKYFSGGSGFRCKFYGQSSPTQYLTVEDKTTTTTSVKQRTSTRSTKKSGGLGGIATKPTNTFTPAAGVTTISTIKRVDPPIDGKATTDPDQREDIFSGLSAYIIIFVLSFLVLSCAMMFFLCIRCAIIPTFTRDDKDKCCVVCCCIADELEIRGGPTQNAPQPSFRGSQIDVNGQRFNVQVTPVQQPLLSQEDDDLPPGRPKSQVVQRSSSIPRVPVAMQPVQMELQPVPLPRSTSMNLVHIAPNQDRHSSQQKLYGGRSNNDVNFSKVPQRYSYNVHNS